REPSANDAVDEPEADDRHRQPGDQDAKAERADHEQGTKPDPEEAEPERANLPAEVRFEPRATRLAALYIVQDHRDDRRPAGQKGADHRRRGENSGQQAEGVERVNDLCPRDERALWANVIGHARKRTTERATSCPPTVAFAVRRTAGIPAQSTDNRIHVC